METFSALLAICAGNSPVPVNSPHKGQWRGALMFSLICVRINGWVNNREDGDLGRYRAHSDVIVMYHKRLMSRWCPSLGKHVALILISTNQLVHRHAHGSTILSWFIHNYGPFKLVFLRKGNTCVARNGLWGHKPSVRWIPRLDDARTKFEGILPKGPYLPCVSMAGRALLAGYYRNMEVDIS